MLSVFFVQSWEPGRSRARVEEEQQQVGQVQEGVQDGHLQAAHRSMPMQCCEGQQRLLSLSQH